MTFRSTDAISHRVTLKNWHGGAVIIPTSLVSHIILWFPVIDSATMPPLECNSMPFQLKDEYMVAWVFVGKLRPSTLRADIRFK